MWAKLYARKSRALNDPDEDEYVVLSHQIEPLVRLARQEGVALEPADIIAEIGSGESIAKRPRFAALLAELEHSPPPAGGRLYVTEISRLSRAGRNEWGEVERILKQANIKVRDLSRTFDFNSPDDTFFFSLIASLSQREIDMYRARARAAYERNLRQGRIRCGQAPFGYTWSKDQSALLVVEHEFTLLQRCCQEVLTSSIYRLAQQYAIPQGTLANALTNPAICGWPARTTDRYPLNHALAGQKRRLGRAEFRWPECENTTYPHACTREEWERIQQVLTQRHRYREKTVGDEGWCRDLVRFVDGPDRCRLASRASRQPPRPLTYKAPTGESGRFSIGRGVVHAAAYELLAQVLGDPRGVQVAIEQYWTLQAAEQEAPSADEQRCGLTRKLAGLRRRYQDTVDAEFDAEGPLKGALTVRRQRLEREIQEAEQELANIQQQARAADRFGQVLASLPAIARNFPTIWATTTEQERRAFANAIIKDIHVACDSIPGRSERHRYVKSITLQPWFAVAPQK